MPLELIVMDAPGFAIDEAPKSLGTALKLPPRLEAHCPGSDRRCHRSISRWLARRGDERQ